MKNLTYKFKYSLAGRGIDSSNEQKLDLLASFRLCFQTWRVYVLSIHQIGKQLAYNKGKWKCFVRYFLQ